MRVSGHSWATFVATISLASCSATVEPGGPPDADQLAASKLALSAWRATVGPTGEQCDPTALWWRVVPPEDVGRWCGAEPRACYRDGEITLPAPHTDHDVAHELAHWLGNCSGLWADGDPQHEDARVWPAVVDATVARMRGSP